MRRVVLGAFLVAVLVSSACSSSASKGGSTSQKTTVTTTQDAACVDVKSTAVTGAIKKPVAAAKGTETLGNGYTAYYVATSSGALWVTDSDPATDNTALVLPLNAKARSLSDTGTDVSEGAPIFGDASVSSTGAQKALDCASKQSA